MPYKEQVRDEIGKKWIRKEEYTTTTKHFFSNDIATLSTTKKVSIYLET